MVDNQSIVVHSRRMLKSVSVDEILLLRHVNWPTNFRGLLLKVEMAPSRVKHMYSVLFAFPWGSMPPASCSRLCSSDSAWTGVSKKCLIICLVYVCYNFCRISSCFFKYKIFSFVLFTDVRSTYSSQIINKYDANGSPSKTLMTIAKKFVSLSGDRTIGFVFRVFIKYHYTCKSFFGETINL